MAFHPSPSFSNLGWLVVILGAFAIGANKGGLTGLGVLPVICFASVMPARGSTGIVLPLLIVGDICAAGAYWRVVQWKVFWRLLPLALIGVVIGFLCMGHISEAAFRPMIGWMVMALVAVQLLRNGMGTRLDHIFDSSGFGWFMGLLTGVTTMIANAAGPVAALYLLSVRLPKWNLIGTVSWLFLVINLWKVPFSAGMGLLNLYALKLTLELAPLVVSGFFLGRFLAGRMPQKIFEYFLLACTAAGALRLIWL